MARESRNQTSGENQADVSRERLLDTESDHPAFSDAPGAEPQRLRRTIVTKIRSHLQSSLSLFLSFLFLTLVFMGLTNFVANYTRYKGLEYDTHISYFNDNPQNAIFVIHIFSALTLILLRRVLTIASEVLRWSLATRRGGTYFLNLLVLSDGTGFLGLCRIVAAHYPNFLASPRVIAISRLLVVYGGLLVAHFILLLNIESQRAYVQTSPINGQTTHLGLGDFNFSLGEPWPFPQVDTWLFLEDGTRVVETKPTVCTPNINGTCHSFLLLATPINYTYSCAPAPGGCGARQEWIKCPNGDDFCDIEGIFYDLPAYIVEFEEQQDGVQNYAYRVNYTSHSGTHVSMWMGNSAGNTTSSSIDFYFDMCQPEYKSCDSDNYHPTRATMYISKANVTLFLNLFNQTILDISDVSRAPYEVNVSLFFQAYTAPLASSVINFTTIGLADNNHTLPSELPITGNSINSSLVADAWVDSAYYGLNHNLKSSSYNMRAYGFPAHALAVNARVFEPDGVNRTWVQAKNTTVLSINMVSIYVFNCLTGAIILISIAMRFRFTAVHIPKECSFPDIALVCKELDSPTLEALKLWENEEFRIRTLAKVWIQVSREGDDGPFNVSIIPRS